MNRRRWGAPASFALALAGVALSAYLTVAHYTSPTILACADAGIVSCERVTTSLQSAIAGVPVALLGLLWSVAMAVLCAPAAWRSTNGAIHTARLLASTAGMAFVLWLVYAELYIIGAICLWCTGVHVLTFALFAIIVTAGRD